MGFTSITVYLIKPDGTISRPKNKPLNSLCTCINYDTKSSKELKVSHLIIMHACLGVHRIELPVYAYGNESSSYNYSTSGKNFIKITSVGMGAAKSNETR